MDWFRIQSENGCISISKKYNRGNKNKMKNMTRAIAVLLVMLVLVSAAVSCADKKDDGGSGGTNTSTSVEETTDEAMNFDPGLPALNFEDSTFTFLTKAVATYGDWGETTVWTETQTGDVINDSVFIRNSFIEETYKVKFVDSPSGTLANDIAKSNTAGDGAYDVVMPAFGDCGTLAAGGNFINLFDVEYINVQRLWWDQRSVSDLTVANKLFFAGNDISTLNNDATWCTMFNKEMIEDYTVDSPYDLVAKNEWTYENFYGKYQTVSTDINGNGKFDADDIYANLTQNENYNAMYIGSGERLIEKDADDIPVIGLGKSERSVGVLEDLVDILTDEQFSLNYHTKASSLGYHLWTTKMFEESRGLFWITNLQIVIRLRDLETPMGIVPVPKYSADQESYSNVVWTVGSYSAILKTVTSTERSGAILEAMSAKSMELLKPAYYDIALNGKYLRDNESIEMLDIIIKERVYDLGLAYGFGGINSVVESLVAKKNTGLASAMESKTKSIQSAIDKIVEKFSENT